MWPPPLAIAGDASWAVVGTGSDIKKYALNIPDKDWRRVDIAEGRGEFRTESLTRSAARPRP